mmetsp:Transcript_13217/g.26390  ORF Transcript_13217/g.26390 Transcript_13217/m.26390 type:complete len:82 (+) Transcript_13217:913-1158(+)
MSGREEGPEGQGGVRELGWRVAPQARPGVQHVVPEECHRREGERQEWKRHVLNWTVRPRPFGGDWVDRSWPADEQEHHVRR